MSDLTQRRKEQAEALMRDGICEAVVTVLVEVGLGGLTMDRVADAAGVSKGTLYNYFRDKDALILEVIDRTFTPLQRDMARIAEGRDDPRAALKALTHALFFGIEERRGLAAVLKEGELTEVVRAELGQRMAMAESLFADLFTAAADAGQLDPSITTTRQAGRLYFLSLHGVIDHRLGYPEHCPPFSEELAAVESLLIPLWFKETP